MTTPRLHPTPARRDLLDQMDNGQVLTDITAEDITDGFPILLYPDAPTSWQRSITVTARARELERAGWAEEREGGIDWQATPYGRAIRDIRVLDFGDQIIAEMGDEDEPRVLGQALDGAPVVGYRWQLLVGKTQSLTKTKNEAREELRHQAALVLAAETSAAPSGCGSADTPARPVDATGPASGPGWPTATESTVQEGH
jgi:hypothetical protein